MQNRWDSGTCLSRVAATVACPPVVVRSGINWRLLGKADLKGEPLAEVEAADFGVGNQFVGGAGAEDAAFGHDVGAVGDGEGFADVMVGDENADALVFEIKDDLADVVDC